MPPHRPDASMLVLPGGGYRTHAPHEGAPVVAWLEAVGWTARVVEYPLERRHPEPLTVVQREIARERAAGARRVGVLGFSAGGHLAGLAALAPAAGAAERPDFAVLGYPAVSLVRRPHVASRAVLIGDAGEDAAAAVSLELLVAPGAPEMFVWHTVGDPVVPVQHSYLLAGALADAGVAHELHVFPGDVHGIGLAEGTAAADWTSLAATWLARR